MSELWLAQHTWSPARLSSALACLRRFQLKHILRLEPSATRDFEIDLEFGHAWHEAAGVLTAQGSLFGAIRAALALAAQWPKDTGDKKKTPATLVRSLVWYEEQFKDVPLALLDHNDRPALEVPFSIPLFASADRPERLQGVLDGVVEFGGEVWVLERKTTGSALSGHYWSAFDPNVQIDVYCLAAALMWPQWSVQGVLVEAMQTGVNFTRFERKMFRRTRGRLEETLGVLQSTVNEINQYSQGRTGLWRPNPGACMTPRACPYRNICTADPSMREWTMRTQYAERPPSDTPFSQQEETPDASNDGS